MPKPTTVIIDASTAKLVAAISTVVVGNLMAVLHNKGLIDREDVADVVAFTRAGEDDDDPATAAMTKFCAYALAVEPQEVVLGQTESADRRLRF
jgi:hypothetical protein